MSSMTGVNETEESDTLLTGYRSGSNGNDPLSHIANPVGDLGDRERHQIRAFNPDSDDTSTHKKTNNVFTNAKQQTTNPQAIGLDENKFSMQSNSMIVHCDERHCNPKLCHIRTWKTPGRVEYLNENQMRMEKMIQNCLEHTSLRNLNLMRKMKDLCFEEFEDPASDLYEICTSTVNELTEWCNAIVVPESRPEYSLEESLLCSSYAFLNALLADLRVLNTFDDLVWSEQFIPTISESNIDMSENCCRIDVKIFINDTVPVKKSRKGQDSLSSGLRVWNTFNDSAWSEQFIPTISESKIDISENYSQIEVKIFFNGTGPVKKRRKGRDSLSFRCSIYCSRGLSNGFIKGAKIASYHVMICLVVITNFIFATKRKGTTKDVSLIVDKPKSAKNGDKQHEERDFSLDFSLGGVDSLPSSGWKTTDTSSFSESPLIYVDAPGLGNYENEIFREETFNSAHNLHVPASLLARHGFYWNGQHAQCYSCDSIHAIDDVIQNPEGEIWHSPTCRVHNRHGSYRASLRQVASDTPGRISDDVRDPPGQQSTYIPPGDDRVESYRLSTFNSYPVHSPMDRKALAKGGFYFTGYSDRVKCFACGRTVERWEPSDNPLDLMWHKDSCPHPRGGECGNVPSTNLFARLQGSSSAYSQRNSNLEVLEQRDPRTGEYTRTVRYPTDLPERVRRGGGTFEIGPNNNINIQSGGISHNPGNGEPRMRVSNTNSTVTHQPPRQWRMANVISSDHRRFLNNLYLNRELDRLVSFARWPTGRPTVSPTDLARNGFFYLGDMDRTQCFSCAGVLRNWTANDSARMEHRTHFPNCQFVLGTEARNVTVPMQPETPQERQRRFPCRFPSNPHMRSEATRLDTFDSRWPMGRMAATPEEIARAGFFFLGERDRVKCWYCNGGLQHWDYDDAPWVEHAKWFPNCQFLLSFKGQHFVYRHLTTSAYLSRPIIARQEGATVDPSEQGSNEPPEDIPPPSPGGLRGPTPPPTIVDPREEMRKKEELVEKALKESDIVKNVLAMGFSTDLVRIVLKEKLDAGEVSITTDIYETVSGLLEAVMQKETEEEQRRQNEASSLPGPSSMMPSISSVYSSMTTDPYPSSLGPSPGSGKYNVSLMDEDDDRDMYGAEPMSGLSSLNSVTRAKQIEGNTEESSASLQEALNKIEEERMCKICFANQADMVFVPCGHMCCCRNCTEAIRHCPVCRVRIEKAIKTYLQ